MSTKDYTKGIQDGRNGGAAKSSSVDYLKGYEQGKDEYYKEQERKEELSRKRKENGTAGQDVTISIKDGRIGVHRGESEDGDDHVEVANMSVAGKVFMAVVVVMALVIFGVAIFIFAQNFTENLF